jgi:HlyD family secretion protein
MRRLLVVLGSGVLIALAAGTHFATPFSPRAETNRYLTAPIERGDLVETLQATGSLTARVTVAVGSEVSGQIAETVVDFNDEVREGEVLARLDPRSYESRVRAAEASLAVAKAATDVAKAALRRAEARVHGVELQLIEADAEVDRARAMALEGRRTHERAVKLEHTLAKATIEEAEATHKAVMADLRAARARRSVVDQTLLAARAELAAARADVRYAEAAVAREVALLDQASLDLERTVIRSPVDGVVIRSRLA